MKSRQIKEMMRDISPEYQQKADARAASVQHSSRRSIMPALLAGGAAACCACLGAVIILPHFQQHALTSPDSALSEIQEITESSEDASSAKVRHGIAPFDDLSDAEIRFMSPAYAPYALEISAEEQKALAKTLDDADWEQYSIEDNDNDAQDGENVTMYVNQSGDKSILKFYPLVNAVQFSKGDNLRQMYHVSPDAVQAVVDAAQKDGEALTDHMTWCAEDTLNSDDFWKNFAVYPKECDMSVKEDIFYKMNNAIDYFDRASGIIKRGSKLDPSFSSPYDMSVTDFQVNLNTVTGYEHIENYNGPSAEALINDDPAVTNANVPFTNALQDGIYYSIDYNSNHFAIPHPFHRIDCPTVQITELPKGGSADYWDGRRQQLLSGIAVECLENSRLAAEYLGNFDKWEIIGPDQVNGRVCVQIDGTVDYAFDQVKHFVLFVDEETGVVVRLFGYDDSNELVSFLDVTELAFDDDAKPVETIDTSGFEPLYELVRNSAPSPADESEAAEITDQPALEAASSEPVTDPADEAQAIVPAAPVTDPAD